MGGGGVVWMSLNEIGRRNKGTNITAAIMKELNKENGTVRVFAAGNTTADVDYADIPEKDIITEPSIIVKSRGYIGFEYYEKPFTHKNEMWSYTINRKDINQKFVYYYLITQQEELQKKARALSVKLPQLSTKDTDNLLVPIPSLAKQERIVGILDQFDALVNDISVGLPAEIDGRRKQYEYYRNKLLTFDEVA